MEIPGVGGGTKQKTFHGGSMDIFWNYTFFSGALLVLFYYESSQGSCS